MENTLENKRKFLLHCYAENIDLVKCSQGEGVVFGILNIYNHPEDFHAEPKPLSSITDEDMSNMANFYEKSATNIYIHDFQLTFDYYEGDETHSVAVDLNYGYCLDYLRSNGFAMDWMGLSVEKLQQYNWIKLKK